MNGSGNSVQQIPSPHSFPQSDLPVTQCHSPALQTSLEHQSQWVIIKQKSLCCLQVISSVRHHAHFCRSLYPQVGYTQSFRKHSLVNNKLSRPLLTCQCEKKKASSPLFLSHLGQFISQYSACRAQSPKVRKAGGVAIDTNCCPVSVSSRSSDKTCHKAQSLLEKDVSTICDYIALSL